MARLRSPGLGFKHFRPRPRQPEHAAFVGAFFRRQDNAAITVTRPHPGKGQAEKIGLWALPGALLRHRFIGFHLTDGAYVLLSGGLVFLLARRLSGDVLLAVLAGVFALVWAPRDMNRLVTVQATVAAGPTFATLLALVLLVESWVSGRRLLLALAGAVAFVTVRSYEATAALMLGGSLLVVWMAGLRSRRAWAWAGAFGAVGPAISCTCIPTGKTGKR